MTEPRGDLDRLIVGYLIDDLAPGQLARLQERLRQDPEACRRFVELSEQDFGLRTVLGNAAARPRIRRAEPRRTRGYWLGGLAAAGVLAGIMIFFGVRPSPRGGPLPDESKGAGPVPGDRRGGGEARPEGPPATAHTPPPPPPPSPPDARGQGDREVTSPPGMPPPPRPPEVEAPGVPGPEDPPPPPVKREGGITLAAVARLERVEGRVLVSRDGQETEAQSAQQVLAGQDLKVPGANSRAVLRYPDGTTVTVWPATTIRDLQSRGGKRVLLAEGTLEAEVSPQPRGEPMVILTPQGEATVLGTSLRVIVDGKGNSTRLEVEEGRVQLKRRSDGRTAEVTRGHHAVAAAGIALMPSLSPPTLEAVAGRMRPGTWAELRTKGFGRALLDAGQGEHILMFAQEAKWDLLGRQVHALGFSRPDGTRHVLYDLRTNAWHPVPLKDPPSGLGHAYDHLAFDPRGRKLYFRGYDSSVIHEYDLAGGSWTPLPVLPRGTTNIGALEYFPEMNGLVLAGSGDVWLHSLKSGAWKNLAANLDLRSFHNWAEHDPVHKVMILGDGNYGKSIYRLDASGQIAKVSDAPVSLGETEGAAVADPSSGRVLLFSRREGGCFYEYDVLQDRWTRLDPPPAPLMRTSPRSCAAAAAIGELGVVMFLACDSESSRVFLYRHGRGLRPGRGEDR